MRLARHRVASKEYRRCPVGRDVFLPMFGPETFAQHADLVCSVSEGATPAPEIEPVSSSWQRSANEFGVDPVGDRAPRILTSGELKNLRETRLVIVGTSDSRTALVTPPVPTPAMWRNATNLALHARPRLDVISRLGEIVPRQAHGGLSPGAMRRVREYVEAHLSESTDLTMLAAVAGLSTHHFAREFKQSCGVTPHQYLTRKRVARAEGMLANTDLSLSEIAYAVGFSDQSHLTRHFRQMLGITPGQYRWSQRQ
jgi:AraC-like DNA-binding protein